jgi:hypothetical protein
MEACGADLDKALNGLVVFNLKQDGVLVKQPVAPPTKAYGGADLDKALNGLVFNLKQDGVLAKQPVAPPSFSLKGQTRAIKRAAHVWLTQQVLAGDANALCIVARFIGSTENGACDLASRVYRSGTVTGTRGEQSGIKSSNVAYFRAQFQSNKERNAQFCGELCGKPCGKKAMRRAMRNLQNIYPTSQSRCQTLDQSLLRRRANRERSSMDHYLPNLLCWREHETRIDRLLDHQS